ncbi:hypothetical protein QR680_008336 [Steinernema hermaphroditum]|uniref:eIF-4F 25 kDa subunit n=1 Tax=Steinernema hermaphroditum TaxID=289476 RepID=A0AA39IIE8_9BILA|nr:hypothetical protein QR680_008336 [Steinernema hermaphroditum]
MKSCLILLALLLLASAQCPGRAIPNSDKSKCLHLFVTKTDFLLADQMCRLIGGHLVSISNVEDNDIIQFREQLPRYTGRETAWTGGNNLLDYDSWTWTDGQPFNYTSEGSELTTAVPAECFRNESFLCATDSSMYDHIDSMCTWRSCCSGQFVRLRKCFADELVYFCCSQTRFLLKTSYTKMEILEATPKMVEEQMEFTVEKQPHPLQRSFTMWYLRGDRTREWLDCLKQLVAFNTVEGFWAIYNHILPPSRLDFGSDYYVFRKGIKPMWEDDNNAKGGRWLISIDRTKRSARLDAFWIELLIALIGEQFEDSEHICGIVVNCRHKGDKISVWTRDAEKDDINLRIGMQLKKLMDIPDSEQLLYVVHKVAAVRSGSMVKPRLSIPRQLGSESSSQMD